MLDALLHEGQHASVVGGDAAHEAAFPRLGAEDDGVLGRQKRDDLIHVALDLRGLRARRQRDARREDLTHRVLASCPREDERDGGQQLRAIKRNQRRGTRFTPHSNVAVPRARAAPTAHPGVACRGHELGIELPLTGGRVQVKDVLADDHVLIEGDGTLFGHDNFAGGAHFPNPGAKLLGVRHRGRQGDDRDVCGQVNDHFLPHRAAHLIRKVMDLVEDDDAQVAQGCAGVDHVAQDLSRHDDDRGTGVDRRVSGCQADVVCAVQVAQLQVLLVGQCLDRRRVERAHSLLESDVSAELADDRLSRTGGRGNEDGAASLDGIECLDLKRVRGEAQRGDPARA